MTIEGPNLGIRHTYGTGFNGWDDETSPVGSMDDDLARLDAVVQLAVLEVGLNTPPGGPSLGDRYVVGSAPTGAWATHAGEVAVWAPTDGGPDAWAFHEPKVGWLADDAATGSLRRWDGTRWRYTANGTNGRAEVDSGDHPYTVVESDRVVQADASGMTDPLEVLLPTAEEAEGRFLTVVNAGASGSVDVVAATTTAGPEEINGANTLSLVLQYKSATLYSDGVQWWIHAST